MSAAAPTADAGAAVPVKKGKKKLIIMIAAVLLLLVIAGGGAAFYLKKKAAAKEAEGGDDATSQAAEHKSEKPDLKHPPTFLPLDPFVVNLADKDADRYAQIGITLEVADAHFAEEMKAFMPAIRNGILMILAHKSSKELLDRAGKEQLAAEILRDSARTMGIEVEEPEEAAPVAEKAEVEKDTKSSGVVEDEDTKAEAKPKPKAKKKVRKEPAEPNPIHHVHFSNFIVQ
jgi:flagellar FliL protein